VSVGGSRGRFQQRSAGAWWGVQRTKLQFERGLDSQYPRARGTTRRAFYEYQVTVPVACYDPRRLRIEVYGRDEPTLARVFADGPVESKHRFSGGSLCMWEPEDGEESRWQPRDGLVRLIDMAILHLFREAWWRETGCWPGPEAPHREKKEARPT